jgi:hypothetical protein
VKLIGDCFCDFALNGEDVVQWTIVDLRPKVRVGAGIDELRIDSHFSSRALHAAF